MNKSTLSDNGDRTPREVRETGLLHGLSAKLLVMTIGFVMLAELLIWTPSIAQYRKAYLEERIARAYLAMIAVGNMSVDDVEAELENELLFHTGTYGIVLNFSDRQTLMVSHDMPPSIDLNIDMDRMSMADWVVAAFSTLLQSGNRVMRVIGSVPTNPDLRIDVIIDETPMRDAMLDYSKRILGLSIAISVFTATLVFLALQWMMVRPVLRMAHMLARFRKDPEAEVPVDPGTSRQDEIGVALHELGHMQQQVRASLRQKTRLATLGEAVAKINHDLRNSLATAVLAFDRLSEVNDPDVQRLSPRLYKAISRAVELCTQTLEYAGASDFSLRKDLFHLRELISEITAETRETVALQSGPEETGADRFRIENRVPFEVTLAGDRTQLFRALLNLALNAYQAGAHTLEVSCRVGGDGRARIRFRDDGPGLPEDMRDRVFEPFASARDNGTGLGLVIVHDIIVAHGGNIRLAESGPEGAVFDVVLPEATREPVSDEA